MTDITWLQKPLDKNGNRIHLRHPFSAVINGIPYAVATNGHGLVMIEGEYGLAPGKIDIAKLLIEKPAGPLTIETTIEKLKAWCGDPLFPDDCKLCEGKNEIPCQDCGGQGFVDCYHCGQEMPCDSCDGEKTEDCPEHNIVKKAEYGRIGKVPINKKLLARFIYGLNGPATIAVGYAPSAIQIHGYGWRVLIMPMHEDSVKHMDLSQFEGGNTNAE